MKTKLSNPEPQKRGRKPKSIAQYEREAKRLKNGCLIHPSWGVARRLYQMRHGDYFPRGNSGGLRVCHTCDTPRCIEDKHHFLGTQRDNVLDAVNKKRHSCFRKGGVRFSGPHKASSKKRIVADVVRRWKDPEYKARVGAAIKKAWERNPEQRKQTSLRSKKRWEEFRRARS